MKRMWSKNELKSQTNELLASGNAPVIKGGEIVENMSGYSFVKSEDTATFTSEVVYAGAVKNGNKLTLVIFGKINKNGASDKTNAFAFQIPSEVSAKIYPYDLGGDDTVVDTKKIFVFNDTKNHDIIGILNKRTNDWYQLTLYELSQMDDESDYLFRYEVTFLLSENLAPHE